MVDLDPVTLAAARLAGGPRPAARDMPLAVSCTGVVSVVGQPGEHPRSDPGDGGATRHLARPGRRTAALCSAAPRRRGGRRARRRVRSGAGGATSAGPSGSTLPAPERVRRACSPKRLVARTTRVWWRCCAPRSSSRRLGQIKPRPAWATQPPFRGNGWSVVVDQNRPAWPTRSPTWTAGHQGPRRLGMAVVVLVETASTSRPTWTCGCTVDDDAVTVHDLRKVTDSPRRRRALSAGPHARRVRRHART